MTEAVDRTRISVLKVAYLLAVTAITFIVPAFGYTRPLQWIIIPGLLVIQVVTLLASGISAIEIARPVWRLKWLFVFLLAAYALLPAENKSDAVLSWRVAPGWLLSVNMTGLEHAALMCIQIVTVFLTSAVVRLTGDGNDLVRGLHAFRLPPLFVHSLDQTLELLGGVRRSGDRLARNKGGNRPLSSARTGEGQGAHQVHDSRHLGFLAVLKPLIHGDVGPLVQTIQAGIQISTKRTAQRAGHLSTWMAHDVAIVSGIALCMASIKIVKVLPGIPFASGHKAVLLIPLYVLAARLTHSRWGATAAGTIMGVIGFLQGDGRFGILEIFKHVGPGIIIDIADPLMRRLPQWALCYCILGVVASAASTMTDFIIVFFLGARSEIYIFPAARLLPQLAAGFLSGFVTKFLLAAFRPASSAAEAQIDVQTSPTEGISTGAGLPQDPAVGSEKN